MQKINFYKTALLLCAIFFLFPCQISADESQNVIEIARSQRLIIRDPSAYVVYDENENEILSGSLDKFSIIRFVSEENSSIELQNTQPVALCQIEVIGDLTITSAKCVELSFFSEKQSGVFIMGTLFIDNAVLVGESIDACGIYVKNGVYASNNAKIIGISVNKPGIVIDDRGDITAKGSTVVGQSEYETGIYCGNILASTNSIVYAIGLYGIHCQSINAAAQSKVIGNGNETGIYVLSDITANYANVEGIGEQSGIFSDGNGTLIAKSSGSILGEAENIGINTQFSALVAEENSKIIGEIYGVFNGENHAIAAKSICANGEIEEIANGNIIIEEVGIPVKVSKNLEGYMINWESSSIDGLFIADGIAYEGRSNGDNDNLIAYISENKEIQSGIITVGKNGTYRNKLSTSMNCEIAAEMTCKVAQDFGSVPPAKLFFDSLNTATPLDVLFKIDIISKDGGVFSLSNAFGGKSLILYEIINGSFFPLQKSITMTFAPKETKSFYAKASCPSYGVYTTHFTLSAEQLASTNKMLLSKNLIINVKKR